MRLGVALAVTALLAAPARAAGGLEVGDPAPDFSLQASDGKTYRLADYRGRQAVVLAWFPRAFTKGCTVECKSLAEKGDLIRKYDVTYFMASVDPVDENARFAEKYGADFPLLSDPAKDVARSYGVLHPRGFARRWTFYIGTDGRILAIDKDVKPASSAEDIAARLGALGTARADAR